MSRWSPCRAPAGDVFITWSVFGKRPGAYDRRALAHRRAPRDRVVPRYVCVRRDSRCPGEDRGGDIQGPVIGLKWRLACAVLDCARTRLKYAQCSGRYGWRRMADSCVILVLSHLAITLSSEKRLVCSVEGVGILGPRPRHRHVHTCAAQ